ncbi:MAG TPA: extracellular solute-binding protein [Bacilli bacterium]|nr:extracellular solute-binding protein [Bacilli bacterium]HPK86027.1 extracellular solute-binding protein [Bacilli bacterium]
MKKIKLFRVVPFFLLLLLVKGPTITSKASENLTLRILNWHDYIYEPEEEGDDPSIVDQFKADYKAKTGKDVNVIYELFTTNEDMYSKMKLSEMQYDLLCPSDYMIQRLIREDRLEKFDVTDGVYTALPAYQEYVSPYLRGIFDDNGWTEYSAGYMWGTMGLVYNTDVANKEDVQTWDVIWDSKYAHKVSIKDSMRDTYLVGLFRVHKEEVNALKAQYEEGTITAEAYNDALTILINDTSDKTIAKVEKELNAMKENIFGFEVDSGKFDIVTGKIAINTAWSGDAVYSIGDAPEGKLRYALPKEGSNVWFDGWVMPKGANKELAQAFVNFLSEPSIAVQNVDYIGYSPFIAGDEMLAFIEEHDEYSETGSYTRDLSYFFGETLTDPTAAYFKTDEEGAQLTTQFPSEEEITRCVVMKDFGDQNQKVVEMWTRIRSTKMSPVMIVLLVTVPVVAVGLVIYFVLRNKKNKRHQRRKGREASA